MEVVLLIGPPASGKTTVSQEYKDKGYSYLSRDAAGHKAKLADLNAPLDTLLAQNLNVLVDNTHPTRNSRADFIAIAKKYGARIKAVVLQTSIEDAQFNAALRMIRKYGKLVEPEGMKKSKDPNLFPVLVLFKYRKNYEQPASFEGFDEIEYRPFVRTWPSEYTNRALILDYDGTLRETLSGEEYPRNSSDIRILPGRIEKLREYQNQGYRLLGVSNQSGVSKGALSHGEAKACFDKTNQLLGLDIEYVYCPHNPAPITCYCRKPMTGWAAYFIEKYKLNPSECLFIGDRTTDKTFAERAGLKYLHPNTFFQ